MDPKSIAFERQRNGLGTIDHSEGFVLYRFTQFADVDVSVALGPPLQAVDRQSPTVAPEFAAFGNGEAPVGGALRGSEIRQELRIRCMEARERQPAVGLIRVGIAQDEEFRFGGLRFGGLAERTFARGEGLGAGNVAQAGSDVGVDWEEEEHQPRQSAHWSDYTCGGSVGRRVWSGRGAGAERTVRDRGGTTDAAARGGAGERRRRG